MTAFFTRVAPPRLNVGSYSVRVEGFVWESVHVQGRQTGGDRWARKAKALPFCTLDEHVATAGGLEMHKRPWHVRRYRRATNGGAGVYQLELWSFLAGRRHSSGADVAVVTTGRNDTQAFRRFFAAARRCTRPTVRWHTPFKKRKQEAFKGLQRAYIGRGMGDALLNRFSSGRPYTFSRRAWARRKKANLLLERLGHAWALLAPNPALDTSPTEDLPWSNEAVEELHSRLKSWRQRARGQIDSLPVEVPSISEGAAAAMMGDRYALRGFFRIFNLVRGTRRSAACLIAALTRRADAYRAYLDLLVKVEPFSPLVPRPRYADPKPPTAPLAPPAL